MKIKNAIGQGRARIIEQAVEAWKADHDDAMRTRDVEGLITLYLEHCAFLKDWYKEAWDDLLANELLDPQGAGEVIRDLLVKTVEYGRDLSNLIAEAKRKGYIVDRTEEFRASEVIVSQLHADIKASWPWMDQSLREQSLADYEAGRCRPAQEILDELRRPGRTVG